MSETGRQAGLFKIYCFDTSSLINFTKPRGLPYAPYPKKIFPTIWKKLEDMIRSGTLISHERVYKEIEEKDDELLNWCNKHKTMFHDIDECQINTIRKVEKCYNKDYWEKELQRNQEWADPWIIALSFCENAIIVSDERNSQNHIPFIAAQMKVQCINLIEFFYEIGIKY